MKTSWKGKTTCEGYGWPAVAMHWLVLVLLA